MTGISALVKKEPLLQILGFVIPGYVGVMTPQRIEGLGHRVGRRSPKCVQCYRTYQIGSSSKSVQDVFWCSSVQEELNDRLLSSSVGAMEGGQAIDISDREVYLAFD